MQRVEYYLTNSLSCSVEKLEKIRTIIENLGVRILTKDEKLIGFCWNKIKKDRLVSKRMNVIECFCVAFAFSKQFYNYTRKGRTQVIRYFKKEDKHASEEWLNDETIKLFEYLLNHFDNKIAKRLVDYYCARIQESLGFHSLAYFLHARIMEDLDKLTYDKKYKIARHLVAHSIVNNKSVKEFHRILGRRWDASDDILEQYNLLDWRYHKKLRPLLSSISLDTWSLLTEKLKTIIPSE